MWQALAAQGLGKLMDIGFGALDRGIANKQSWKYYQKTSGLDLKNAQQMARYNQGLAIDTWNKTNAEAQMQHLIAAGLNPGLMYGMSGSGGTTNFGGGSAPSGKNAPGGNSIQGMDILGAQRQLAETKNIEADTKLKEVEASKREGADTELIYANIEKLKQETQNAKVQNSILEYENRLKSIEANVSKQTEDEQINAVKEANKILIAQARQELKSADFSEENYNNLVTQANLATLQAVSGIDLTKANIEKTRSEQQLKEQEIIFQKFENQLTEKGITTKDNVLLRGLQTWLSESGELQNGTVSEKGWFKVSKILDALEPQWLKDTNKKTIEKMKQEGKWEKKR